MASIFRRMFKVAESHAHSAMDNLEDPIKMTEQGIRDLKTNLGSGPRLPSISVDRADWADLWSTFRRQTPSLQLP